MIEQDIISALVASSSVMAQVGSRIYPSMTPQPATLPLIVVNMISGGPIYADDGETGLDRWRVQVDAYAASYASAKAVQAAVRSTLSALRTAAIPYAELDAVRDLQDAGSGETSYPFRASMDFIILARS